MRADLDMNNNKIINLAEGVGPGEAVNWDQLDQQNTDLTDYVDAGLAAQEITSMDWDVGNNLLTLNRGDAGTVTETIKEFDTILSGGAIRHKSDVYPAGAAQLFATNERTRWTAVNNGATTFNFTRPTGADPYLGENYCVEGTILITNGGTPGVVTIQADGVNVPLTDILGSEDLNPSAKYLLSYVIHRKTANVYDQIFIWSAV